MFNTALASDVEFGLAASAWAQPMGKGMGHRPGMMNVTPEQASQLFDLKEKMHADTAGLRKQMMVKRAKWRPVEGREPGSERHPGQAERS